MLWDFKTTSFNSPHPFLSSAKEMSFCSLNEHTLHRKGGWAKLERHFSFIPGCSVPFWKWCSKTGTLSWVACRHQSVKLCETCVAFAFDISWHLGTDDTLQRYDLYSCVLRNTLLVISKCSPFAEHNAKGEFRLLPDVQSFRGSGHLSNKSFQKTLQLDLKICLFYLLLFLIKI